MSSANKGGKQQGSGVNSAKSSQANTPVSKTTPTKTVANGELPPPITAPPADNSPAAATTDMRRRDRELGSVKIHTRKLLIVGLTGSGKSRLISAMCQSDDTRDISHGTLLAGTKTIKGYLGYQLKDPDDPDNRYVTDLYDTIGLGDGKVSTPDIIADILTKLADELALMDRVVFCLRVDRLRVRMAEDFVLIHELFKGLGATSANLAVVVTFCDFYNDAFIQDFMAQVGKHLSMFSDSAVHRTYVSFPDERDLDVDNARFPQLKQYIQSQIRESRLAVFDEVIKPDVKPFSPTRTLLAMSDEQYVAFRRKFCDPPAGGFFFRSSNQTEESLAINAAFDNLRKLPRA